MGRLKHLSIYAKTINWIAAAIGEKKQVSQGLGLSQGPVKDCIDDGLASHALYTYEGVQTKLENMSIIVLSGLLLS